MILVKILTELLSGILDSLGGWKIIELRRFAMPIVIGIAVGFITKEWYLGVSVLGMMGTLTIGYSGYKWLGRGLWMALQCLVGGLGCLICSHLAWVWYLVYIGLGFLSGATLYEVYQPIGDFIFGLAIASLVWIVH